jgi:signal transduction histidine kinase
VSNVVKHARARHAWLHLALRDDTAELVIEDDGIGLHASAGPGEHFGVVGMRERVEGLGGSFALGPRPGGGVRLRAILPVREGADVRHPRPVG